MVNRSNGPCFVVTRRIYVNKDQAAFIDQKMDNRLPICTEIPFIKKLVRLL